MRWAEVTAAARQLRLARVQAGDGGKSFQSYQEMQRPEPRTLGQPQRGPGTEGTAGQGPYASIWHGVAPAWRWHCQERTAACPRECGGHPTHSQPSPAYQGSWGPANTGGREYWWPGQGWGGDGPRSPAGEEGRWAESLARCRTPSIFAQKREREEAWDRSRVSLPPLAAAASQRGPGVTPKHRGLGGVSAWSPTAAFPSAGRGKQGLGREVCPGGPKPRAHSTALLLLQAPGAPGSVAPPEVRAPAQPSGEGMCPAQQILKHSRLSLKTNVKKKLTE